MDRKLARRIARIASEAGASVDFEETQRHDRVVLGLRGRSRFVVVSRTPSDDRAERNIIADIRRTIRSLAA